MSFLDKLTGFGKSLGSAVSPFLSIASGVSSLFGNNNINKQIKAQQEENQKNRDYNLMLAKMQNQWSQDQWERENEYNTPLAQRQRLQAAGLNADLMYGNGAISNIAASSPAMTSGAPSSPSDMSALGHKKTIGDMIRDSQSTRLAEAQIKSVEAQARKINAESGLSEIELRTKSTLESMFGDLDGLSSDPEIYRNPLVQRELSEAGSIFQDWQNKVAAHKGIDSDSLSKAIEYKFKEREVEAIVKDLENRADISKNEAEYLLKTLSLRIAGVEYDTALLKDKADIPNLLNNAEGIGKVGSIIIRFLKYILDGIPILK